MQLSLRLLALTSLVLLTSCVTHGPAPAVDKLRIEAWASTNGEFWKVRIAEFRDGSGAEVQYESFLGFGRGELSGSLAIHQERVSAIKALLASEEFFDLPLSISKPASGFHRPDFFLNACLGKQCRKVNLYDPSAMGNAPEAQRFLSLWDAVVEPLPLKPAWK